MTDSLLTVPQPITDYQPYLPTGNEYVSLPTVRPDGCIESVNVLSMQALGLLEFAGNPLIAPRIGVEGQPLNARTVSLPVGGILTPPIVGERDSVRGQVLIFAPPGHRGFVVLLQATNGASEPREVTLEIGLQWAEFNRVIFSRRETGGHRHFAWDAWTRSPTFEDTSHAAIDVEFAFACFRGGIVFSRGDIRRLIATLKEVSRDGKLTYRVDGAGQSGRPIQIGMWGLLAHVDPQIRQAILDFLVAGYQEQPVIGMVSAGYLVQTERPFEVEASLTPVTQPSNTGPGQQN